MIRLNHVAIHYSYRKVGDFLHKMQIYSELFAKESKKKSSLWKAIGKSWAAFFRSYVVKGGWRLGKQGYIISRYQADVAYYKYLKLDEKNLSLHM